MTDTTQTPGWPLDRDRDRSSRRSRWRVAIACLATVAAAGAAEAQVAHPLDELVRTGDLRRGVGVYVTDADGRRLKGTISEVSSTELTVTQLRDTWTWTPTDVRKIELQDPLKNGIWRGLAVGVAMLYGNCLSSLHTEVLCGTVLIRRRLHTWLRWFTDFRTPLSARSSAGSSTHPNTRRCTRRPAPRG